MSLSCACDMCLASRLLRDCRNRLKKIMVAFRLFPEALSAGIFLNCRNPMFKAISSMNMVASIVVFLSASLGSPHHWQEMNYSSFSPWHVGHRTPDRTADTLTRAAFRPVFRRPDGSTGVGREIVPCHALSCIGQRKTPKQFEVLVL